MTIDPLSDVRAKIKRAKKHISDLEAEIAAFKESRPYRTVLYDDPQTGEHGVKIQIVHRIPCHWAGIIGDAIHNLRSALDLLACAIVRANGGASVKGTYFPISADRKTLETTGLEKIKGASQKAINLIKRLEPYQGGNGHVLWQVHQLDILDKHSLIVPVGAAFAGFHMQVRMPIPGKPAGVLTPWLRLTPADRMFPLEDGAVLMRGTAETRGREVNANYKFIAEIAFGEGQVIDGKTVIPTLKEMVQFIEGFVAIFAKEIFGLP